MDPGGGGGVGGPSSGPNVLPSSSSSSNPVKKPGGVGGGGPKLFVSSLLEPRDDLEDRHDRCFAIVQGLIADKGDKEANDALSGAASKAHEEICVGLIVGILGDPENAPRYFR